jgi:hypothetical protein
VIDVSFVMMRLEAVFVFMDGMELTGNFDALQWFGYASLV